ncbi:uncharacterized protein LOC141700165 isoform X2 [Apium graveolens]|uniref:uncharacterized protein LOC141700165 isoform X2 n=1 Tax=Apium graveolens TaxID=4045 RepID=UPI003D7B79FA
MNITVLVETSPEIVYESSLHQCTAEEISLQKKLSGFRTPKVEHDDNAMVLGPSPDSAKSIGNLVKSLYDERKELEDKFLQDGRRIGEHEQKLKTFHAQRLEYEKALSELQASLEANSNGDSSNSPEKERMLGEIESRGHTAASNVCKVLKDKKYHDFSKDMLGVVELLGSVETNELASFLERSKCLELCVNPIQLLIILKRVM